MNLFDIAKQALNLAGVNTPAFEAIFEGVKAVVAPAEQVELQADYEAAKRRSDTAHDGLQSAGRGE